MQPKLNLTPIFVLLLCFAAQAQETPSAVDKVIDFPTSFFNRVQYKYASLEDRL
jgi:hypothetical protein